MAMRPQSVSEKSGKQGSKVLGRSAATGRVVLMPASKAGSISVTEAAAAIKRLQKSKKK